MKAIQVHKFMALPSSLQGSDGNYDSFLSMKDDVPKPSPLKKHQMLVRVFACSLSPGDVIMVQGNMILMHQPFPFIPGMDICGEVVNSNDSKTFKNGDIIVASNGMLPVGGMAEFMVINESEAVILPQGVSKEHGASSSSAVTAHNAVIEHVKEGDRVLILGGSGGVGSAAIQIAKVHAKASFVATTSTQEVMCKDLGADRVINYKNEDWWTIEEFQHEMFDVIIDCAGGGNFYGRAEKVLKTGTQGGTFVAVTAIDEAYPDCGTVWKLMKFFGTMMTRVVYTKLTTRTLPKYSLLMPHDEVKARKKVLEWMAQGTLKIKLDGDGSLPFTAEGVRQAFIKIGSHHAHGKVVVTIAKE
jgi:NADPH:quinone reductase-like Zn-dependent oxidoreductase